MTPFVVVNWRFGIKRRSEPILVLERGSAWNDYGYATRFTLYYWSGGTKQLQRIGQTKILSAEQPSLNGRRRGLSQRPPNPSRPSLQQKFNDLGPEYCSVGQSSEFYRRAKQILGTKMNEVLLALRDIRAVRPSEALRNH